MRSYPTAQEWAELKKCDTISVAEYKELYLDFMYNPDNIGNCTYCPDNHDPENWGEPGSGKKYACDAWGRPCGQPQCWVVCHCKRR